MPVSNHGTLNDIQRRFLAGVSRPTRNGGTQRYFDAAVPYRASLMKHFRDPRPFKIVAASPDPVLLETLRNLFERLPCDLIPLADPVTTIDPSRRSELLTKQMRTIIKDTGAACGVAIAEDAQGISLYDERGRLAPAGPVLLRLGMTLRNHRQATMIVSTACDDLDGVKDTTIRRNPVGRESLVSCLLDPEIALGLEPGGRLWIKDKDKVPTCDAVLTIGLLLRCLSSSGQPFSTLFSAT